MTINQIKNAADLFIAALEAEGVQYIFGVPGEENLDFMEALRQSKIKFIVCRHEQAAVFMAATMGRLTGKAGVALSTLGPGATNMVTAIAHAQLGGMPLIVVTGQKPVKKSKQGRFQIIDVVAMMSPLTKFSYSINSAERIPSLVRQAFKLAESERPGAAHLELPEDIAAEPTSLKPITPVAVRRPGPDPEAIAKAVKMISQASRPIVLVGNGANRKRVRKHLQKFVDKTKIPFVTTQMGKGVLDETSPNYIGNTALSSGDYVHCALQKADLIITLGHDITEKPPVILTPHERKVIHINFYESEVDNVYVPALEVIGDIAHSLWALTQKIKPNKKWDWSYFYQMRDKLLKSTSVKADSKSWPFKPQRLVSDLRKIIPASGILCLDNGMYKLWVARSYPAIEQNTVLLDNALATMGAGLPSAMAAKILYPKKEVVALVGDGGFMMNSQELETAVRLKLNLTVIILTDYGYGMIKWKQKGAGYKNYGLEFSNPNFVKYAEAYGAKGYKIKRAADFSVILKKCLKLKGVKLIDCPIDYSENELVFNKELKEIKCDL
ncbi:MAG: acetolactate synthase large subunit [Candidatus Komeilibacteria bacterium]|nr:acetolactate synthase large subunit [Candidatus Komeilibacteria bacterium]